MKGYTVVFGNRTTKWNVKVYAPDGTELPGVISVEDHSQENEIRCIAITVPLSEIQHVNTDK